MMSSSDVTDCETDIGDTATESSLVLQEYNARDKTFSQSSTLKLQESRVHAASMILECKDDGHLVDSGEDDGSLVDGGGDGSLELKLQKHVAGM